MSWAWHCVEIDSTHTYMQLGFFQNLPGASSFCNMMDTLFVCYKGSISACSHTARPPSGMHRLHIVCPPRSLHTLWCPQLQQPPLGSGQQRLNSHIGLWWDCAPPLHAIEKYVGVALVTQLDVLAGTCNMLV